MPTFPSDPQELLLHDGFLRALAQRLAAPASGDDVAQETWLAAVRAPSTAIGSLRHWLAGTARHLSGRERRSNLRRFEHERERAAEGGQEALSPDEILEREDLRRRVVLAVLELGEPARETLILRFFENLPPRAVARRLRVPVATVHTRTKRALVELRARLDRDFGSRAAWLAIVAPLAERAPAVPETLAPADGLASSTSLVLRVAAMSTQAKLVASALAAIVVVVFAGLHRSEPVAEVAAEVALEKTSPEPLALPSDSTDVARAPATATAHEATNAGVSSSEGASLRVRARWHDGTPAEGLGLRLERARTFPDLEAPEGVTDERGEWTAAALAPGDYRLNVDRAEGERVELEAGVERVLELALPRGFDLVGSVVDLDGVPVANAEIRTEGFLLARSDARGTFSVRSLEGATQIHARAPSFAPSFVRHVRVEETDVELVLPGLGGELAGVVLDERGVPIAGAELLVGSSRNYPERLGGSGPAYFPPPLRVAANERGEFLARGTQRGSVAVSARACGFAPSTAHADIPLDGGLGWIELRLADEWRLRGTARDAGGAPLEWAWIELLDESMRPHDPHEARALAGADGRFELAGLPPGRNRFAASAEGEGRAQVVLEAEPGDVLVWDPTFVRGTGEIDGRIVDEHGAPLSGLCVLLTNESYAAVSDTQWLDGTSDGNGHFLFEGLREGPFALSVYFPESNALSAATVVGLTAGEKDVLVRVSSSDRPSARIVGQVLLASGEPAAGVQIVAHSLRYKVVPVFFTNPDGSFSAGPLMSGTWTLHVTPPLGLPLVEGPRELGAGETWDVGTLQPQEPGSALVRIESDDAALVAAVRLRMSRASVSTADEESAQGALRRFAKLAPDDYEIQVSGDGVARARVALRVEPGRESEVVVRPERGVEVRVAIHCPLASRRGETLLVSASRGDELPLRGAITTGHRHAPKDGAVWGLELGMGEWRVEASTADGERAEGWLSVEPGAVAPLELELALP